MSVNKVITKSYLESLVYDKGFNAKQIQEEIQSVQGTAPSIAQLKQALKQFGIDLKKKPRTKGFIFVDDSEPVDEVPFFPTEEMPAIIDDDMAEMASYVDDGEFSFERKDYGI